MFKLNKLLNQTWFEMKYLLMLLVTAILMVGTFFHAVHTSDKFASKYNVEKVEC